MSFVRLASVAIAPELIHLFSGCGVQPISLAVLGDRDHRACIHRGYTGPHQRPTNKAVLCAALLSSHPLELGLRQKGRLKGGTPNARTAQDFTQGLSKAK